MERRLAAIVAADLVGYSRMMRADEETTLLSLRQLREDLIEPKVAEHRGRIFKLMGDGLLAEFSSTVDAVVCCAEMQIALAEKNLATADEQKFEFRVGVNVGDVIIDGDDVQGDGVNIAARLEHLSEPGGMCISDAVYEQVRDRLDIQFRDLGLQEVKNIDRPVRSWGWSPVSREPMKKSNGDLDSSIFSERPALAVLPFDNMSGDPDQEYFSDGITEDIITDLSRFRDLMVIARNTTFTYKGRAINVSEVSRELNARYVVEGSVRKSGNRVRVTAQLIDGETGSHIWADRYDGVLEDVFELQDEITTSIVTAIAPQCLNAEIARATRRESAEYDAWDTLMRARWHMTRHTPDDVRESERLLRDVLRQNPRDAVAHAWLAWLFLKNVTWGWEKDPKAAMYEAIAAARRAASLDSADAHVLAIAGIMMTWEGSFERGVETCRRAVELNPNSATAQGLLAATLGIAGNYEEARRALSNARRLSPLDPEIQILLTAVSLGAFAVGEYQDVLDMVGEVIAANPHVPAAYRLQAAAQAMLSNEAEAKRSVEKLLEVAPSYSISLMREFMPLASDVLERHIIAMRKAGLPE